MLLWYYRHFSTM